VQRGEIYWVDFEIPKGSEQGGRRPALIIQNDVGNMYSPTTIVAAITSKQKQEYRFHVEITKEESGLRRDSTILLEQLRTITQDRLISKVGTLSSDKMEQIDKALKVSLGLSS